MEFQALKSLKRLDFFLSDTIACLYHMFLRSHRIVFFLKIFACFCFRSDIFTLITCAVNCFILWDEFSVQKLVICVVFLVFSCARKRDRLNMMFKIVNNLIPINFNDHLRYCKTVTRRNHPQKLNILAVRTDTYKFSFFPRTIPEWNSLPAFVAITSSVNAFRQLVSRL